MYFPKSSITLDIQFLYFGLWQLHCLLTSFPVCIPIWSELTWLSKASYFPRNKFQISVEMLFIERKASLTASSCIKVHGNAPQPTLSECISTRHQYCGDFLDFATRCFLYFSMKTWSNWTPNDSFGFFSSRRFPNMSPWSPRQEKKPNCLKNPVTLNLWL